MTTAVTESARVLNPLSVSISNGILRSIDLVLKAMPSKSRTKGIEDLAYSLQLEYPKESRDYVMHMAISMYKDVGNDEGN